MIVLLGGGGVSSAGTPELPHMNETSGEFPAVFVATEAGILK